MASLSLPANHQVVANILERTRDSPTLDSLNEGSLEMELRTVCRVEHLKELKYKQCGDLPAMGSEEVFCPVERTKYWTIFDEKRNKIVAKQIQSKKVKLVNLWLRKRHLSHNYFNSLTIQDKILSRFFFKVTKIEMMLF